MGGLLDEAGQPIPKPKRPPHEDVGVVGGVVSLGGWLDGVGDAAGDVGGLLDEAGQPMPRPKRPPHEDVGEGEGSVALGVVLAGVVAGEEAGDGEQPRPRPNNSTQDDV